MAAKLIFAFQLLVITMTLSSPVPEPVFGIAPGLPALPPRNVGLPGAPVGLGRPLPLGQPGLRVGPGPVLPGPGVPGLRVGPGPVLPGPGLRVGPGPVLPGPGVPRPLL